MSWSLLAAGFCFYIPSSSPAKVPLIALFVYIFTGTLLLTTSCVLSNAVVSFAISDLLSN